MDNSHQIIAELKNTFGEETITEQQTVDALPTVWLSGDRAIEVLRHLKTDIERVPIAHSTTSLLLTSGSAATDRGFLKVISVLFITSFPMNETKTSASRLDLKANPRLFQQSPAYGLLPTGTNARHGTCSASPLKAIRTCGAY